MKLLLMMHTSVTSDRHHYICLFSIEMCNFASMKVVLLTAHTYRTIK